jgi:hypothetical protein
VHMVSESTIGLTSEPLSGLIKNSG